MNIELPKKDPAVQRAKRHPEYVKIYPRLKAYVRPASAPVPHPSLGVNAGLPDPKEGR